MHKYALLRKTLPEYINQTVQLFLKALITEKFLKVVIFSIFHHFIFLN